MTENFSLPSLPTFGIYIHFPFCQRRCPYCDFTVSIWKNPPHEAYADGVLEEFRLRAPEYRGLVAKTLAFGGGTPGMWAPESISRVINTLEKEFGSFIEISCEANPEDASLKRFHALRKAGITRLSLGVQSFDPQTLSYLGRLHKKDKAIEAVQLARDIFPSVSLDLIAGGPSSSKETFLSDLKQAVSLDIAHISVYGLTIEQNTRFAKLDRTGQLKHCSDDALAERLILAQEFLQNSGFEHYEVSNYARPGNRSLHNSLYWTGGSYLGLGCGAHSFFWQTQNTGIRTINTPGVRRYFDKIHAKNLPVLQREILKEKELFYEMLLSQSRYKTGFNLDWFFKRFGVDLLKQGGKKLFRLQEENKVCLQDGHLRLTAKGMFFADDLLYALCF